MLTPSFVLDQTATDIILTVHAPLANIAVTELSVVDDLVIFYSSPYYLRLHLPGKVVEIEGETGTYLSDSQEFSFVLKKVNPGEHFSDLDLIGKLLIPPKKFQLKPDIKLCNAEEVVPTSDPESDEELLGYIKQEVVKDKDRGLDLPKYGFANKGQGIGQQLKYEFREILDFVDFENTPTDDRSLLREADEQAKFSEEHYLADFMEDEEVKQILDWECDIPVSSDKVKFSSEEKERLKNLGNRDYLLDSNEKKTALLSLVDVIFAFAYNERTTFGESNVESAWTINKLSSTLSWLQSFNTMYEAKVACARRALIFPLYRHWQLTMAVFEDTSKILHLGRKQLLKCFLKIHEMFANSEPRYLLNELYINDYCIWIQKISENKIRRLADHFDQIVITKEDVRLELIELEGAALIVKEEEELNITNRLMDMKLSDRDLDRSDESVCEEESEDENTDVNEDSTSASSSGDNSILDSDDISSEEE